MWARRRRYAFENCKSPNELLFDEAGVMTVKDLEGNIRVFSGYVIEKIGNETVAHTFYRVQAKYWTTFPAELSRDDITVIWTNGFIELEVRPAIAFLGWQT